MSLVPRIILFVCVIMLNLFIGFNHYEHFDFYVNMMQLAMILTIGLPLLSSLDADLPPEDAENDAIENRQSINTSDSIAKHYALRMCKSLSKHLDTSCSVIDIEKTKVAFQVEFLMNDGDILSAYEELAIIPFDRVRDIEYWQKITKIIMNNYTLKFSDTVTE